MATNTPETDYMPKDWWLARKIGKHLFDTRYAGLDIKTQVTLRDDKIDEIVVAVPMTEKHYDYDIANMVQFCCDGSRDYKLIVNGTGRYLKHGPVGDCGTTGRKLAVDFYGSNCVMGGVCVALYGFIAASGLKMLQPVDLNKNRNLFVASVIFIVGVGGMTVSFGAVEIRTVACALILGILTNLMLSGEKDE